MVSRMKAIFLFTLLITASAQATEFTGSAGMKSIATLDASQKMYHPFAGARLAFMTNHRISPEISYGLTFAKQDELRIRDHSFLGGVRFTPNPKAQFRPSILAGGGYYLTKFYGPTAPKDSLSAQSVYLGAGLSFSAGPFLVRMDLMDHFYWPKLATALMLSGGVGISL